LREIVIGLVGLRRVLSIPDNPPILQVIQTGKLAKIIAFLDPRNHLKVQFESAWIICNIASGDNDYSDQLASLGVI
jgi:importin subunit alpha-1